MDGVVKLCKYGHMKTPENTYKNGNCKECQKAYQKAYSQKPERKATLKAYGQSPECKAKKNAYQQSPEGKAYQKAWYALNRKKAG
jgi:hypothetical protein